jgi:enoyl-CoA hydratase/carnithine racemase
MAHLELTRPRPDVALITLNQPDKLNALNYGLVEELHATLEAIDADDECRVAVLTGAGRGFCGYGKFGVESTKQVLWANLEAPSLEAALHVENRSQILATTSGEIREATAAFATRKR